MDRLVCGDAGYGKTEVAMRAAFIAAMNGKQTVVLAPTTVLAEQHFETFTSRFDGTPIRIECLSRFKTASAKEGTLMRLESGACDILIGTHAVLSKRVKFKDLGLVIIDEEQRFGVRHKEKLRSFSASIDILTLSATPIPRTLYLSMIGTRDLSLLRTPPRERQVVETIITQDNDETIKRAIEKELASGGQVFYLHNRVNTIYAAEKRINELVPNAKTVVAHGRMDAADLAQRTKAFEKGEFDILISTTIVESGIDIPRANTIIIERADMFGLADLYQLRGRVGRSAKRGRAILLLPPSGMLERDVIERLEALKRSSMPGAGFSVALRDLEFRGAGNLLGPQQSGHVSAIGFTLYCQLLKKTIAEIKGEKIKEPIFATLNFDFTSSSYGEDSDGTGSRIPYFYIEEDSHRMLILRKIAETSSLKDITKIKEELIDRFGPIPAPVQRLLKTAKIRIMCSSKGIGRIDVADEKIVLRHAKDNSIAKVGDLKGKSEDAKLKSVESTIKEYEPVS
jgi:transcription-repair coupling factor (superfamily II helicase)